METNGVGWLAAIIIGGIAGWLAEKVMKSDMGVFMNIILGILGAVILNAILAALDVGILGVGWIAYLITGFIGACLLIFIARLFRRR
ncbi:GlsB/YeaQ/YmgE family stress response membrane protein [Tianweitania sediminis]|uniref:GlsB/YeaQ/YmgE family stress response membrane protein n=1 Tax=Tianweitania sediminis TaxID=1502156 RepID=A0A8J7UL12_9HYPH|nr:GlsB/YeaQ/YmgE family stress response membrane protein [Tianweitania sediminis]MBP0440249.1 GlsB/YeaQ/YmgE family stress response membrane protein [Tianweitania sediminis]